MNQELLNELQDLGLFSNLEDLEKFLDSLSEEQLNEFTSNLKIKNKSFFKRSDDVII